MTKETHMTSETIGMPGTTDRPAPDLPRPEPDERPITGRRITLERVESDRHGADLWDALGRDRSLWEGVPPGPFADPAAFAEWLRSRAATSGQALYAIMDHTAEATDGRPVAAGLFLLLSITPAHGTVEMGLMYGPRLSRRATGTEAFHLLAGHVLGTLGYRRLEWRCATSNRASNAAARRYGFTQEGVLRQSSWTKGANWDTAVYSILDHEWPAIDRRLSAWLDPANFDAEGRQIRPLASF